MAKQTGGKAAPKKDEKALAVVSGRGEMIDVRNYSLMADPMSLQAMVYNLQGEQISEFDLDRIKVPPGGMTVFQIPTPEGQDHVKEIVGIILHIGIRKAYWSDPNPSGSPPDCYSTDGIHGTGDPGGACAACPLNEFGSAIGPDGKPRKGKRCREMRTLLMIRENDRLPVVVTAPPASIKGVKQYLLKGLPVFMFQAITKLTLAEDKSSDGIPYSRLVPHYVGHIDPAIAKSLALYAQTLKAVLVGAAPVTNDFFGADETRDPNIVDGVVDPTQEIADSIDEESDET